MSEPLERIAAALERLAPASPAAADWLGAPAYVWDGGGARAIDAIEAPALSQLIGIDRQKRTVRDNIAFGLTIRKRPKGEIVERVSDLLRLVQLQGYADRYPAQLSGGQRQRMALARALAAEPTVLLLDEPFGALDARVRAELRDWLRRLHEEVHVTTVFVTHDQEEAMEVADRVAVLNTGRLEQVGTPVDLYDEPASEFVMRFVGDAHDLGGGLVRPHEIVLRHTPGDGSIEVEVERIVVLGADARVELVDGEGARFVARLRREELDQLDLERGEILWAQPERERVFS